MIRLCSGAALLILGLLVPTAHAADDTECHGSASLTNASQSCVQPASHIQKLFAQSTTSGYLYRIHQQCKRSNKGSVCSNPKRCDGEGGAKGTNYSVLRKPIAGGAWEEIATSCLTAAEADGLHVITPAMARDAMRRLSWPRPELTIQPPDGQTLVDFDTNFFTRDTATTTQTVSLLGQRVTIEARPSRYVWHYGDGSSRSTTSPGAAYPHTVVTHSYEEVGHVRPSVDTVYAGRYRVNDGGWQAIPGTLTVSGETVPLWVRSASPSLAG